MDADHIGEMFSAFGAVTVKRMFGSHGLYAAGLMFGLIDDGVVYLKADDASPFEREGGRPFTYAAKGGRRVAMSFWRLPERLYDDPDELAQWARTALIAARRAATKAVKPRRNLEILIRFN